MNEFSKELLAPLGPEETALEELFRQYVHDDMLRGIAEADYGYRADYCFEVLKPIRDSGTFRVVEFCLQEVLELTRWDPSEGGERGHWMRLFACATLLRIDGRLPGSGSGPECETLGAFVSTAIQLGDPVARASASFLAWRFLAWPGGEHDRPFLAFAILLLAVSARVGAGAWWKELADWVEAEEAAEQDPDYRHTDEWLFGLTFHRQHEGLWRWSARQVLLSPEGEAGLRTLGRKACAE